MRRFIVISTILLLAGSTACQIRARATIHVGHGGGGRAGGDTTTPTTPTVNQTGSAQTCTSSDDCPDGTTCLGEPGCGEPWTCQPARPCTRDLVVYCGCNGETFRGSGTCPGRPYRARGTCDSTDPQTAPPPIEGAFARPPVTGGPQTAPPPIEDAIARPPVTGGPQTAPPPIEGAIARPPITAEGTVAEGGACTTSTNCSDGLFCLGHEGCDTPATCVPRRPCTLDLRAYCGCNGETFRGSGTCPPRNFVSRGACVSDGPVPVPGDRQPQ
jgi:hypothetical protein